MTVYFLHNAPDDLVKIGHVASPERVRGRLMTVAGADGEMRVISMRDGSVAEERALQMRHALSWASGEWFDATPAVMAEAHGFPPVGDGFVDSEEVRGWLRSWKVRWSDVAALSGVSMQTLAAFADGGPVPRPFCSVPLGKSFLVMEGRIEADRIGRITKPDNPTDAKAFRRNSRRSPVFASHTWRQEHVARLAIEAGWSDEAVSMWRKRGRVPAAARLALTEAAEKIGERLEASDFEGWQPTRGPRGPKSLPSAGARA